MALDDGMTTVNESANTIAEAALDHFETLILDKADIPEAKKIEIGRSLLSHIFGYTKIAILDIKDVEKL